MNFKDCLPTEEQRLKVRAFTVEVAAWIAVMAVLVYRFLVAACNFFCDKVLPLARISATHAVLAWQDYTVARVEYFQTVPAPRKLQPKGFRP